MGTVIAVVSIKGGAGKTTLVTGLAGCIANDEHDDHTALIVDADNLHGAATKWSQIPGADPEPRVVTLGRRPLSDVLASETYDVAVVDSPPNVGRDMRAAMVACAERRGVVVIPCKPAGPDFWGMDDTLEQWREAVASTGKAIPACVVLMGLGRDNHWATIAARERAAQTGLPVYFTRHRQDYQYALTFGTSVMAKRRSAAAVEMRALTESILTTPDLVRKPEWRKLARSPKAQPRRNA